MSNRFSYVRYDEESAKKQERLKAGFEFLEKEIEASLPGGRYKALCLTAMEETYMWTGKSIRDEQIARTGKVDEQPERASE